MTVIGIGYADNVNSGRFEDDDFDIAMFAFAEKLDRHINETYGVNPRIILKWTPSIDAYYVDTVPRFSDLTIETGGWRTPWVIGDVVYYPPTPSGRVSEGKKLGNIIRGKVRLNLAYPKPKGPQRGRK